MVSETDAVGTTTGFAPILGGEPRVLVLGSLPSRKSIELNQYYGHPRNGFWPIMGELFGAAPALPYAERVACLVRHRVAVWDVLASSVRPGSLDAAIDTKSASPNDFATFFATHPGVKAIFFNGKAAAALYGKLVAPTLQNGSNDRRFTTLPSTSPANAAMRLEQKLAAWRPVADAAKSGKRRKK